MKTTGKILGMTIDQPNRKPVLQLLLDNNIDEGFTGEYGKLLTKDKLNIEVKAYRQGRSLSANSYFHVLVDKLANELKTSKPYMKNLMLNRYGQLAIEEDGIVPMIVRDDVDMMEREEIHLRPTDKVREMDDGKPYRVHLLVRGSHTYNTHEMSILIDGTVSECKEQGIETMPPNELDKIKALWGAES